MVRAVKEIVRKYYKYIDTTFVQPILSSNGIVGGSSFATWANSPDAGTQPYMVFDNNTNTHYETYGTSSLEFGFYNPMPIKVTQIIWTPWSSGGSNRINSGILRASNDGTNWITLKTGVLESNAITDLSDNTQFYKYYQFYDFNTTGWGWQPRECTIVAIQRIVQESTAEDYDFYRDIKLYKVPKNTVRKYYKYNYVIWTQPIATGSTTSLPDGNMVITSNSEYGSQYNYLAFDGNKTSTYWAITGLGWWQIKFPYKIKITELTFYNRYTGSGQRTKNGRFYTDNTLSTPIGDEFTAPNTNYGSVKVSNIPSGGIVTDTIYLNLTSSYNTDVGMGELEITATKQTIVPGTSSDYDFYIDVDTYYGINQ